MICQTMSRKMSTSNLYFMGNVMYVMLISELQYSAAELDFVHAMYEAGSDDRCMTARPLGYMQIQEPHGGAYG